MYKVLTVVLFIWMTIMVWELLKKAVKIFIVEMEMKIDKLRFYKGKGK